MHYLADVDISGHQKERNGESIKQSSNAEQQLQQLYITPTVNKHQIESSLPPCEALRIKLFQGLAWDKTPFFDSEQLYKNCELVVGMDEMFKPDSRTFPVGSLLDLQNRLDKIHAHPHKDSYSSVANFESEATATLTQMEALLSKTQLEATQLGTLPLVSVDRMLELLSIGTIEPKFLPQDKLIQRRQEVIAQADKEEDVAEEYEDYDKIQTCLQTKAQQLEEILKIIDIKGEILQSKIDEFKPFENLKYENANVVKEADEYINDKEALRKRCTEDVVRIDTSVRVETHQHKTLMDEFEERHRAFQRNFNNNANEQMKCWKQIAECESQLRALADNRLEQMDKFLEDCHEESKRREVFRQFTFGATHQKELLQRTIFNCEKAIEAMQTAVHSFVNEGFAEIEKRRAISVSGLEDLKIPLAKSAYQNFHTLYLTLQTLVEIRGKSLDILNENSHEVWQMEWLTRNRREKLNDGVSGLRKRQQELILKYEPVMDVLTAHGMKIVRPEAAMQEEEEMKGYLKQCVDTLQKQEDEKREVPPVTPPLDAPVITMPQLRNTTPRRGEDPFKAMSPKMNRNFQPHSPSDKRPENASPRMHSPTRRLPSLIAASGDLNGY
eukprot:TRINITY_DN64893_c0_g1_i1.p1 TRINITY_DN64893_c0_g1~~TRINITY_DN64893_c0_g1_i1.p1  ORF type:complete len:629 (-),score=80.16 TRINITY_DN64893_c0_g1_i1:1556-3391(-)